jgi:V8-like Glu-specific endopeptidase
MSDRMEAMSYNDPTKRGIDESSEEPSSPKRQRLDRAAKQDAQKKISLQLQEKKREIQERIIGTDTRKAVHNPKSLQYPWSAHGHMEMFFRSLNKKEEDKVYFGSGTMIGDKFVITAGHNLFVREDTVLDQEHRSKYSPTPYKITFYPGMDLSESSIPWIAKAKKAVITRQWHNLKLSANEAGKNDFGLLVLDKEVGKETGFYPSLIPNKEFFKDININVTGYPADRPKKRNGKVNTLLAGRVMHTASGKSHLQDDDHIYYDISTFGGNSGSAVWGKPIKDKYYYVGIHTTGMAYVNRAVGLNQEKITLINQWMKDNQ